MNPNLLPAANPASLLASCVLTAPTLPVKVPKPILPDLGGGATVKAVAGPLTAGATGATGATAPGTGTAGVTVGTNGVMGVVVGA